MGSTMAARIQTESQRAKPQPRPGPGRPRQFDSNEILDAALELFWKKGFANTTTRELEAELSLNQSSMYNTFGSKEQFFDAILDRYELLTTEALLKPLEESDDGVAALERFFSKLKTWVTQDGRRGCMLINMMAEDGGRSEAATARATAYRNRVKKALRCGLERAVSLGDIEDTNIDSRTMVLFGLALGLNIAARGGTSNRELEQLLRAIRVQIRTY
jgi:TetR/AcrR family transcriptional repressor of nem operon